MIFKPYRLSKILIPIAEKVKHEDKPVSYSWGNIYALNNWIVAMNGKQTERALGLSERKKYPLIWLVEGWQGKEVVGGIKFDKVTFHIACNSKVDTHNEDRNFEVQYKVANDFIKQLRIDARIAENSIAYFERSAFSAGNKTSDSKSHSVDVWDTLIVEMELLIYSNCLKKLCSH